MNRIVLILASLLVLSCGEGSGVMSGKKVLFLTHSTGANLYFQGDIPGWFETYNRQNDGKINLTHRYFPKARFYNYGWENYPYDYWKIWVDEKGYKFEPSLKKLAGKYDVIIWKHCFPGSLIEADPAEPSVDDRRRSLAVYKMQYRALKEEMKSYPDTQFIVWTMPVIREEKLSSEMAERTKAFVDWVMNEWDRHGDNIHVWDFYGYETTSADGTDQSLYLRPEYATEDSHPNEEFNRTTAPFLCEKIVEVLKGQD